MKNTLITTLVVVTTIGLFAQADGGSKVAFSLKEAQEYAVEHSYFTRGAMMDVAKSEQKVKEITGIGLPQVSGSASYNHFLEIPTQIAPANSFNPAAPPDEFIPLQFGLANNMKAGISVNQLLFDGSYLVGLKASKVYRELAYADQAKTVAEIKRDVTKAYGMVLSADENYRLLVENEAQLKKLVEQNTAMYEAGFMEEKDLDQVKVLLLNTQNILIQTENIKRVSKDMLKFAMGKPIKEDIELTENLDAIKAPFLDKEQNLTRQLDIQSHVDYRRASVNLQSNQLQLSNENYQYAPKLYGFLNYEGNSNGTEFNHFNPDGLNGKWYPTAIIGVQLNVPIFQGGQRHYKVQQAKVGVSQAELLLEQTEQSLYLDLANKRNSYEAAMFSLENSSENLELTTRIKTQTQIKYSEGVSSSVELTQTQTQYLNGQLEYIQAIMKVIDAKAELDYANGLYNEN
ncbi:MAG: TolC family protein [Flavobacteriales bacterium]|nr:TolC family protein [Flavobacteriales bacterium]